MPRLIPLSACLCMLLPIASRAQDVDFRSERERYEGYLQRPSLNKRTKGRMLFARTRDPRAFEILTKSYTRPEEPKDHNKYLIATIVMTHFATGAEDTALADWRNKHRKPIDAWLWYETLNIERMRKRRAELMEIVTGRQNEYVRAAAFAALIEQTDGYSMDPELATWLAALLADLPRKPIERALTLESVASMIAAKRTNVRRDPWKELCRSLIQITFDDANTPRRSKVTVARQLAKTFDCQNLGFESRYWIVELDRHPDAVRNKTSGKTRSVGFAGIRTKGDHIVYVIDASDSMLRPIAGGKASPRGPTTGSKRRKAVEKGVVPTADDLDWSRIHSRFDAAREFLRVSLATLEEDQKFSIVLFGDEAIPLAATTTLTRAKPANIKKAIAELYEIVPGPVAQDRPHGTLRGATNMHGGLRLAYRMTDSGVTKKAEYADKKSMIEGCDTIFLLSDGEPTADDWLAGDRPEPDDQAGDPESQTRHERTSDTMNFYGPYCQGMVQFLFEDVERLNLLRRCEIHCVSIGEAQDHVMQRIASIGNGESIRLDNRLKDRK